MVIAILLVVAALLFQQATAYFLSQTTTLFLGEGKFTARIASSEAARTKGLSGTNTLPSDHALIFVFDYDSKWGIWMKDMRYPIDIVWLDKSKTVVDFVTNVSPNTYPRVYTPTKDARYVVELPSGTVKNKTIRTGRQAIFTDAAGKA